MQRCTSLLNPPGYIFKSVSPEDMVAVLEDALINKDNGVADQAVRKREDHFYWSDIAIKHI